MQAVFMTRPGGPEVLEMRQADKPAITGDHQILVRIRAAGVNPIDTKLRGRGTYFPEHMPAILGCDGAGVVEAVGNAVDRFRPGDEVYYCYGGLGQPGCGNYAEHAVIDAAYAAHKPASLDFTAAAAAPLVLITAWESLFDRAGLQSGQTVLIHAGAGGVGHVAIQLARIAGAKIATTVSSGEKATFVKKLGAEKIIRYREENFTAAVLEWTGGKGVDAALDTVGGDTFNRTIPAVRHYGHLVTLLQLPDDADWKMARIRNLHISQELMLTPMIERLPDGARHHGSILERCARFFDEKKLSVSVADVLPLAGAAEAHRRIEAGHMTGKLVLAVS
ncbi:MAG: zinc-dependent alcohol dehydrogenase family protein [Mariprofundaceae bacterium]|nr:zinc-dependent alcohol dehydrogenase family protein [Mariprofundaceae bacterium]